MLGVEPSLKGFFSSLSYKEISSKFTSMIVESISVVAMVFGRVAVI
jgi:hypothetical protein